MPLPEIICEEDVTASGVTASGVTASGVTASGVTASETAGAVHDDAPVGLGRFERLGRLLGYCMVHGLHVRSPLHVSLALYLTGHAQLTYVAIYSI